MTILARRAEPLASEPRRVRIQAGDPCFFQALAQSYHLARAEHNDQVVTDDTIYGTIRRVMVCRELTPPWKAGAITGWFAALYHIPCRFEGGPIPLHPVASLPRPIDLTYNDPDFPLAFHAGYQAFFAVIGEQPATDQDLYAEIARNYLPSLSEQTLAAARWCAGYLAGFLAALFRVPCFVTTQQADPPLVSLERSIS